MTLAVRAGTCSAKGPYRKLNQDRFFADPAGRLFVVADGMGGCRAGDVASEMAVTILSQDLAPEAVCNATQRSSVVEMVRHAFLDASAQIVAAGRNDLRCYRMGTTAVVAVCDGDRLLVAGWGDSRAYLVRCGQVEQVTRDDTVAQLLVAAGIVAGDDVPRHPWRHVLNKYLGCETVADGPEVRVLSPQADDWLLLVTDGLTDVLDGAAIAGILADYCEPQTASEALVAAALERGSRDNVTCLAMRFVDLPLPTGVQTGSGQSYVAGGPSAMLQAAARVQIEGGPSDGDDVSIRHLPIVVGRSPAAGLSIRDPRISRMHCELLSIDGALAVRDLESTNGTFVNDRRVAKALLKPGDRVQVGRSVLVIVAP